MKKIQLNSLIRKDKKSIFTKQRMHGVYLGNHVNAYFGDMKDAKAFLTATNEFLNRKLYELNILYAEVFFDYRKAWFYLPNTFIQKGFGVNEVFTRLKYVEIKIDFLVTRGGFENGSSIVWQSFRIAIESLQEITSSIIALYESKKHFNEAHYVAVITERLIILLQQIESYGKDLPNIDDYQKEPAITQTDE